MNGFGDALTHLLRRTTQPQVCGPIPPERVLSARGEGELGTAFAVDRSYFSVRLSEMHLRNERELWRDLLPVCITVADYHYAGERRSLPFIVSHEMLREALSRVGPSNVPIQLFDTVIVGPTPLFTDEIQLFTGLLKMEQTDRVALLLDVLAELGNTTAIALLASGLPLARTLYEGVGRLLGFQDVSFLFGMRLGLRVGGGTATPLRSGYFAFTAAPEGSLTLDRLWVKDGRLHTGLDAARLEPLRTTDHCLVALEHREHRDGFRDLPFHKQWLELERRLFEGGGEGAQRDWLSLVSAIRTSPDLTSSDKTVALAAYRETYQGSLAILQDETAPQLPTGVIRGNSAGTSTLRLLALAARRDAKHIRVGGRRSGGKKMRPASLGEDAVDRAAAEIRTELARRVQPFPNPDAVAEAIWSEAMTSR